MSALLGWFFQKDLGRSREGDGGVIILAPSNASSKVLDRKGDGLLGELLYPLRVGADLGPGLVIPKPIEEDVDSGCVVYIRRSAAEAAYFLEK